MDVCLVHVNAALDVFGHRHRQDFDAAPKLKSFGMFREHPVGVTPMGLKRVRAREVMSRRGREEN